MKIGDIVKHRDRFIRNSNKTMPEYIGDIVSVEHTVHGDYFGIKTPVGIRYFFDTDLVLVKAV